MSRGRPRDRDREQLAPVGGPLGRHVQRTVGRNPGRALPVEVHDRERRGAGVPEVAGPEDERGVAAATAMLRPSGDDAGEKAARGGWKCHGLAACERQHADRVAVVANCPGDP